MGMLTYAGYLAEITEDCWRRAGLSAGMRVLDAGCGAGQSTYVAAKLVGPEGFVVGVDRDHGALRQARASADTLSLENLEFREGDSLNSQLLGEEPFDAVVGRDFLVYQGEPAVTVRKLARLVRPGGIIAFLEQELAYGQHAEPEAAALRMAVERRQAADREAGKQLQVVTGFPRIFLEAGLGWPAVWSYQANWGGEEGRQLSTSTTGCWEDLEGATRMMAPRAGAWTRVGV